jgi:hypothetical protein
MPRVSDSDFINHRKPLKRGRAAVMGGTSVAIGIALLFTVLAAGAYGFASVASATLSGTAKLVASSGSSSGQAVEFEASTSTSAPTPIPTPTPTPTTPPISGPFTVGSESWCPSYHTYMNGCNGIDTPPSPAYTNNFNPISLTMDAAATSSGAINTYSLSGANEQPTTPFTVSESVTLACNSSNQIYNWPAFWTVGNGSTGKAWPAEGEIDIVEGLNGVPTWSYHYDNPTTGAADDRSGSPTGNYCGTHTYEAKVTSSELSIIWDGNAVGTVTSADIGEPITIDPQYIINDYATLSGTGGPVQGNETMEVASFSYTSP